MKLIRIASALLLAGLLAACASQPMSSPSTSGLPHKVWTEAELVGKTLDVPKGRDNDRYLITFKGDGTFYQRSGSWARNGTWNVTEAGDIHVFVKKNATLSFYGPAANGQYVYVNPNNPKSGTPWVTFE